MYEMLLMYVKQGHLKNFIKILYCLADRAAPLLTVHCAVGFSRVSLFVFVINDKTSYKKI